MHRFILTGLVVMLIGCGGDQSLNFSDDVTLLQQHTSAIVLTDSTGQGQVVVVPEYQGRVMTSSFDGVNGLSCGWINREFIAANEWVPHINVFGGEERIWLGPEGGQFTPFFVKGEPFDLKHWQTPAMMDSEPFDLVSKRANQAVFKREATLLNYSGTKLTFTIDRKITVLEASDAQMLLKVTPGPTVKLVGYESVNKLTNTGDNAWTKESGTLSIWILGMYPPSPKTTVVMPIVVGSDEELGPKVNVYESFSQIPDSRLRVTDNAVYFKGDGQFRSKIGISPKRAKSICGSYDAQSNVLTIVQFVKPKNATDYVNSAWKIQEKPFGGDVTNSYNDGPATPGAKPFGPFYELETSSPAALLAPGKSIRHMCRTFHFNGSPEDLDAIAQAVLGVSLVEIQKALP